MRTFILITLATMVLSPAYAKPASPLGKVYVYKKERGVAQEMEIYFPKGHDAKKKVPGVIMFHGGGWGGGTRKQFRRLCHYLASRGLVAATADYKLATKQKPGQGSRKRVCIMDAKSAIRWFKQNADKLGIEPNRIITGGGSAGGHICLLATTNPGLNDPNDPKEFDTSIAAYLLFNPALGMADAKDPEVYFSHHVKAGFPPAIVFFGTKDKWLKGWNPAFTKMKVLGIKSVDYRVAEGQEHSFFNGQPWANVTIIAADRFLTKLGFLTGEPTLKEPKTGEKLVRKQ